MASWDVPLPYAANRKVVCASSAPDVASVSWDDKYGDQEEYIKACAFVKAIKAGTAIITVTTVDGGLQASCNVTVLPRQEIEAVDLGLSVKWASMNLGTYGPEEYGCWDEWVYGDNLYGDKQNKYYNGGKPQLELEDDEAHVSLGEYWRMPTIEEWHELAEHCAWSWASFHEVSGYTVTSQINGNSIFLPAAGLYVISFPYAGLEWKGTGGYYWSSTTIPYSNGWARCMVFNSNGQYFNDETFYSNDAEYMLPIRPVYDDRVHPASVSLNKSSLSIAVGSSRQLKAVVSPIGAIDKTVSWSSDRTDVATVDSEGTITAVSTGSAIITVTTNDGNLTATCSVTVVDYYGLEAIDLGLPSGLKWASCNLGAAEPVDYGDYFAWGETEPKTDYSWGTYIFMVGSYLKGPIIKYSGRGGDRKSVLDLADDAAQVVLGGGWRMPTVAEWTELRDNCTWTWTVQNGVSGMLATSSINNNSIFLPAAGFRDGTTLSDAGSSGNYWSSVLYVDYSVDAAGISFDSGKFNNGTYYRCDGFSVRPVSE